MKKMKILGIGNFDNFNYLIVKKDEGFFEWVGKVMYHSFGFIADWDKEEYIDEKDKFVSKKRDIKNYIDKHDVMTSENAKLGIFYGKEKVFITIVAPVQKRKKFVESLEKYSEFVEYKGGYKER